MNELDPQQIYEEIVDRLDEGKIQPFRGYDRDGWHIWVEEWTPWCIESEFRDKNVMEGDEDSYQAEEVRALKAAMKQFDRLLVTDAPGRPPDFEDFSNINGNFGYQVLMWKERSGENWKAWFKVIPFHNDDPKTGFGVMSRVVPPTRVRRSRGHFIQGYQVKSGPLD